MRVRWFGQSAFVLEDQQTSVLIDPFGDMTPLAGRGVQWDYPPIEPISPDLLLVTHEHLDHNAVEVAVGEPVLIRSTAGKLPSPIGEVTAIASEHDPSAGTERGPNTIFRFDFDGTAVCHMGDFGQATLREEQAAAIGQVDLLIVPVGGGPTLGAAGALAVVERLAPRWVVPMHYRTPRIGFLETADEFLQGFAQVHRADGPELDTAALPTSGSPLAVVPAVP